MANLRALPGGARLPLLFYRALFPVAFLCMLPGLILRMFRRGNYRHQFGQRFAIYSDRSRKRLETGGWTWIHAVSVGEMVMGLKLARTLQAAEPGLRILISTTTSTGFALARQQIGHGSEAMELVYYPLDLPVVVRHALNVIRPAQVILVDKELWPNLVAECYRRAIPISIVNARLSPKSERGFLKWRRWVGPFFGMLDRVCVQEPEDLTRWQALGVREGALYYTGSLKFDFAVPEESRAPEFRALLAALSVCESTPVLLGGSTFAGEETILGRVLIQLRERLPDLFLILVPRHVERTREVETALRELGLTSVLRTELAGFQPGSRRPDCLIVNTTGELRDWYTLATVCFIGKSLTAKGGQNPAEPVLAGRPVVFGPNMQNFGSLVRQFLAVEGAIQVQEEADLAPAIAPLLADPARGASLAERARAVLRAHAGANLRTAELLLGLKSNKRPVLS
ncbi:MAG: glycosyltransferase N-terminal domain-containing protein [Verrucomicrobiota bacterium]